MQKARQTLEKVGEDGLTGDERRGRKTSSSHVDNIDENGLNGYQRIAMSARSKQITTLGKTHNTRINPRWYAYRNFADWWLQQFEDELLNGLPRGRFGHTSGYQIDHKYSVYDGFNNSVSPFAISDIANLHIVPSHNNASKHTNSIITLDELLNNSRLSLDTSVLEFSVFMDVVDTMAEDISSSRILAEFNKRPGVNARVYNKSKI
jgi:hypothetical protein